MLNLKGSITAFMVLLLSVLTGHAYSGAPLSAADQTVTIHQGQSATLHAESANGVAFQWLKNGSFIIGATQNTLVVTTEGSYQVMSSNEASCTSQLSDPVNVVVQTDVTPTADVMVNLTSVLTTANIADPYKYTIMIKNNGPFAATDVNVQNNLPEQVQFQQLTPPAMGTASYTDFNRNITWKMDQLDIGQITSLSYTVKALKGGEIKNTATVSSQPTDPDLSNNTSSNTVSFANIIIPNVFTPNGDGVNDVFTIPGLENYNGNQLTIMNRWGATVYDKKDYKNEWDGEKLNEGTYFYLLKVQTTPGKWTVYKGYITLLRNKLN